MKNSIGFAHSAWLSALPAAFVALAAPLGHAQQAPTTASASTPAATTASAPADNKANSSAFSSAFEGYRPYSEEKITGWKEANDVTARIGGWRAYAKEASSAESAPAAAPAQKP